MTATQPILVIGYGNPLRSDDGLGWYVAERLAEQWGDRIEVVAVHQLTPELAERLAESSLAVFIDAVDKNRSSSLVQCTPLTLDGASSGGFTHQCAPQTILLYAKMLYGHSPRAFLISVAGENFDHGDRLTPYAQRAAEAAIGRVNALKGIADCRLQIEKNNNSKCDCPAAARKRH
jgi:hydrogenase maturation protease